MTTASPRTLALALTLLLITITSTASAVENWPQWRGPDSDGVARNVELPIIWSERRALRWTTPLPGTGNSTPAIWDDAIFLTAQVEADLRLLKLDRETGKLEWNEKVGHGITVREAPKRSRQKFHNLHNLASPSPVTDGNIVVAHFGNGDLAAYDFAGKQLWKRNLQDDHGQYTVWWGHANSPVIHNNLVISVCMHDSLADISTEATKSYIVAHDKRNGNMRWFIERKTRADGEECDAYTTPIFAEVHGHQQMIIMGGNQLDGYDPETGRLLWYLPNQVGGRTVTGPVYHDGYVYATLGMRRNMIAVRLKEALPEDYWKQKVPLKLTHRNIAWRHSAGTPDSCTPVVYEDLLFYVTDDGIARCLDAKNGKEHWKERLEGGYKASPLAADGRVFFVNTKGVCTVVSASDRFNRLAENKLPAETYASPAVAGNQIYLRGRKKLFCIGL